MVPTPVVRIAIVGGGCAGMAAAWALAKRNLVAAPEVLYDITVYEKDVRLGGKGASFRDEAGRIREHGLHIWLGFYENAFRVMREAYGEAHELGFRPDASDPAMRLPLGCFDDAFTAESHVGVASQAADRTWESWTGWLPPMKGQPGEPLDEASNPFTLAAYLSRCVALSLALMHSLVGPVEPAEPGQPRPDGRSSLDEALDLDFSEGRSASPQALVERMARWLEVGLLTTAAGVMQGAMIVERWLQAYQSNPQFSFTVLDYLEALARQTRKRLARLVASDAQVRRKTEIIDLIMTIVVGLYRDRVLFDQELGLDRIDDIDCKQWLLKHGAMRSSVESPFVTGLYDLAFCYEAGDRERPALAAGQALRGALRMFFTYRGSIFWRMNSGMGETIFAPLYRVLGSDVRWVDGRKVPNPLPVKFALCHGLGEIGFATGPSHDWWIDRLTFEVSGEIAPGQALDEFGCWPQQPRRRKARAATRVLPRRAAGAAPDAPGFDGVVMALGIDDFRRVVQRSPGGPAFLAALPQWAQMFKHLATIGTQAAQVWLDVELPALGWTRGPVLMSGYEQPLETWADMTHTLPSEAQWRRAMQLRTGPAERARTVIYFCGILGDRDIGEREWLDAADPAALAGKRATLEGQVHDHLTEMLRSRMKPFWPSAYRSAGAAGQAQPAAAPTPLDLLVGRTTEHDRSAAQQHIQANWYGSARYTLALPGTARFRISPLERSVVNMTIAGDWTHCGFNEGCVEAAVMSGLLASHAISGYPALEDIVGYDHP